MDCIIIIKGQCEVGILYVSNPSSSLWTQWFRIIFLSPVNYVEVCVIYAIILWQKNLYNCVWFLQFDWQTMKIESAKYWRSSKIGSHIIKHYWLTTFACTIESCICLHPFLSCMLAWCKAAGEGPYSPDCDICADNHWQPTNGTYGT